jgi:hypothetical protein
MFYDTAKVDIALLCKHCEGRLDIPKILPCGKTICSKSIQIKNNMFDCIICQEKHEISKDGLLINDTYLPFSNSPISTLSRALSL